MPNIKVVSQPKKSPLLDMIIDLEETVNPLMGSKKSVRGIKPNQPSGMDDEEDPDAAQDSDDDGPRIKVSPIDYDGEKDKSQTAETAEMRTGKHALGMYVPAEQESLLFDREASHQNSNAGSVQDTSYAGQWNNSVTAGGTQISRNNSTNLPEQ